MRKITLDSLKRSAAAYLGRYASSSANLKQVLLRRVRRFARLQNAEPGEFVAAMTPLVDETVAACLGAGLVDDAAFAAARTRTLRQRGWPARRIRMGLRQKGVPAAMIDETLSGDQAAEDETAAARFAERRRLGPWRPGDRAAKRDKDIAALIRAGFGLSLARRTIDGED